MRPKTSYEDTNITASAFSAYDLYEAAQARRRLAWGARTIADARAVLAAPGPGAQGAAGKENAKRSIPTDERRMHRPPRRR